MTNTNELVKGIIEQILPICKSWIRPNQLGLDQFVDPIDNNEISAHYGATHAAAAFILWGKQCHDRQLYNTGVQLVRSIVDRWEESVKLPSFHFDFNNFALLLIVDEVEDPILAETIKHIICKTADSNHQTINWLPMRWAVNAKRKEWTGSIVYDKVIQQCKHQIISAINADGGIEDRLPYGISYNLQYNVATVAELQYLRVHGENINLAKELGFLLKVVAPDGDINYLGRGLNQIFAWGLWVYLLSSSGQKEELIRALSYIGLYLPKMLHSQSMMLNEWDGHEKYLWWDYHYISVYTAHCLLWFILAFIDANKAPIIPVYPELNSTGVHICESENAFVCWFDGRSEYLAEQGPVIEAIWTRKNGMLSKGAFGPWKGSFGNKYLLADNVIKNFCGVLGIKITNKWIQNKYLSKLLKINRAIPSLTYAPVFCPIKVQIKTHQVQIIWTNSSMVDAIFNFPIAGTIKGADFTLQIDGKTIPLYEMGTIRNQYSWYTLFQSKIVKGKEFALIIAC